MNKKLKKLKVKDAWSKVMKKGNLWYLAVGILVGSAFGALINSLANDVIMQAIAKAFNFKGVNYMSSGTTIWDWIRVPLDDTGTKFAWVRGLPQNGIMYGKFISALLSFVIIVGSLVLVTWLSILIWSKIKIKKEIENIVPEKTNDELIIEQLKLINAKLSGDGITPQAVKKTKETVKKIKKTVKKTKK